MAWSNKMQKAFFCLLRAGLWNRRIVDASDCVLTEVEWQCIWEQAIHQSVRGLIYEGVCLLPDEYMPTELLMIHWTSEIDLIERRNRHLNKVLLEFLKRCQNLNSVPVVMKGQGIAQFYENPWGRECGDIDLYFRTEDEEKRILDYLRDIGLIVRMESDGSYEYSFQGVEMEHHTRIFDLYASSIQSYLSDLENECGYVDISLSDDSDVMITVPSPILNLLLLNVHILKHSMGHGIGLRQFCDLARAYHVLKQTYDGAKLMECLQKCGIFRWSHLLHSFLVKELHLSLEDLPYDGPVAENTSYLSEKVMKEGNFGMYSSTRKVLTSSVWIRKWNTALSFVRNLHFSMTYAPGEALALMMKLVLGNLKS